MKKSLLILMTLVLSIGQMWADEFTTNQFALSLTSETYKGSAYNPEVQTEVTGYTTAWSDEGFTDAGVYTVTITLGDGDTFSDPADSEKPNEMTLTFTIVQAHLTAGDFEFETPEGGFVYTGSAIEPEVTGTFFEGFNAFQVDYGDNIVAGDNVIISVTITDEVNFDNGSEALILDTGDAIAKASIADAEFEAITEGQPFLGRVYVADDILELLSATFGDGYNLVESTDFEVAVIDGTNVGSASIAINGIGNFNSSTTVPFEIEAISIDGGYFAEITEEQALSYTGADYDADDVKDLVVGVLTVGSDYDDYDLVLDRDYTIAVAQDDANAGTTVTITITGKDNFKESTTLTFAIAPADINNADFEEIEEGLAYTGEDYTADDVKDLVVGTFNGEELALETDYTISVGQEGTDAGDLVTITITGKDNFDSETTTELTFTIAKASITDATFELSDATIYYTGKAQTPEITKVVVGDITIEETDALAGFEVVVAEGEGIDVGDADYSVTIKATDDNVNFTGTTEATQTFNITPVALITDMIAPITTYYTGEEIELDKVEALVTINGITISPKLFTVTKIGEGEIKEIKDYTVTVAPTEANKNFTGTATVTLKVVAVPTTYYTVALSVGAGVDLLDYASGNLQVAEGGYLFLQFRPETDGGEVILTIDGEVVEYTKGTGYTGYILNPIEKNYTVSLTLNAYSVTFPTVEGITFEGEPTAENGKPYTFTMTLADNINPEDIDVYVNDVLVEPDPLRATTYTVTIDKVTGPIVVRVENKTVGIEQITVGRVYSQNGALVVETTSAQAVQVYNLTGKLQFTRTLNGQETIALTPGVYIVRVGREVQKIVVR